MYCWSFPCQHRQDCINSRGTICGNIIWSQWQTFWVIGWVLWFQTDRHSDWLSAVTSNWQAFWLAECYDFKLTDILIGWVWGIPCSRHLPVHSDRDAAEIPGQTGGFTPDPSPGVTEDQWPERGVGHGRDRGGTQALIGQGTWGGGGESPRIHLYTCLGREGQARSL